MALAVVAVAVVAIPAVAVVVASAVVVAVVVAVVAAAVIAVIMSMPLPVRGRHGRQEGESEGCRERRQPEATSRCVSVTQDFLLIP
jgi:hypothetical protein